MTACGLDGQTGELYERRLTPDHGEARAWLRSLPGPVAVTYEAGPTGFGLARFLARAQDWVFGGGALETASPGRGPESPPLLRASPRHTRAATPGCPPRRCRAPARRGLQLRRRPVHRSGATLVLVINVRSCVTDTDWGGCAARSCGGHRCEACRAPADRQGGRGLEVHERWSYDEMTGVQALRRLVALCPACHTTTHYGLAEVTGRADEASWYGRTHHFAGRCPHGAVHDRAGRGGRHEEDQQSGDDLGQVPRRGS